MKVRKKPVIIDAVLWDATKNSWDEIEAMGCPTWPGVMGTDTFYIDTLEGRMMASKGDWIVKGIANEFYPVKPDIFKQTYETMNEMYKCQSYSDDNRVLRDCNCGKCK